MRFKDYIPPDIFDYPSADKFIEVLDRVHAFKRQEIERAYYYFTEYSLAGREVLIKLLSELYGTDFPDGVHEKLITNLINNAGKILKYKGTLSFLKLLLESSSDGKVQMMPRKYYSSSASSFITFEDPNKQFLPDFDDIDQVVNATKEDFLYLYDGAIDLEARYEILIITPFAHIAEFREFVSQLFLKFTHNKFPDTENIHFYFYKYAYFSNTGYPWYYDIKNAPVAEDVPVAPDNEGTDFDPADFELNDFN